MPVVLQVVEKPRTSRVVVAHASRVTQGKVNHFDMDDEQSSAAMSQRQRMESEAVKMEE